MFSQLSSTVAHSGDTLFELCWILVSFFGGGGGGGGGGDGGGFLLVGGGGSVSVTLRVKLRISFFFWNGVLNSMSFGIFSFERIKTLKLVSQDTIASWYLSEFNVLVITSSLR
jgi:hypothetical protein